MKELRDIVRDKVDEMRSKGYSDSRSRSDVIAELSEAVSGKTSRGEIDRPHSRLHLCPWHTCAATRHG
jgi:hypothetical protein